MDELTAEEKRNSARMIAALSCTKLGDVLVNPKTVLTWLLTQMGVSGAFVSLLVPVRESGSMLPQLFVSDFVKKFEKRKRVFVAGALAQAAAVACIGVFALLAPVSVVGPAVLLAVALFATARAFCSISGKDVLGRIVPSGARGRVGGMSATISGVISTAAAICLIVFAGDADDQDLAWIVIGASLLWVAGSVLYRRIDEPSVTDESEEQDESRDIVGRLQLLKDDRRFRNFVIARTLLLGSALASPLLVVLAGKGGASFKSLGAFVVASGIATSSSSFLWGKLSDKASHLAMAFGGMTTVAIGGLALTIAWLSPPWAQHPFLWPVLFLLFNLGYNGVRIGRKTWIVDATQGDERTDYVSASNTIIAVAILVMGGLAAPLQSVSPLLPLALYSLLTVAGVSVAFSLKPEQMEAD